MAVVHRFEADLAMVKPSALVPDENEVRIFLLENPGRFDLTLVVAS